VWEKVALSAMVFCVLLSFAGNRPDRKPGNLAPIQWISALGAWALIFANVSAIAIAIWSASAILLCTAVATLAIALISFARDDVTIILNHEAPEPVKVVVDELEQLLGGAPRLGMETLEAIVVSGNCPGIGVTVLPKGRVVVRVREDVVRWLERQQRMGGARAALVASFVRFTVLHELGHVLNGDHRTFRFVRSVLVAHLMWIAGAIAAAASLAIDDDASVVPLGIAASILLVFAAQSLVARRFIAERERLADWRAMQTLAPADAARLLGRRGAQDPMELEKLMIALKVLSLANRRGRWLARLILLVWPSGDDIHTRSKLAAGDRAGNPPQPVRWAALMGMQCGFLAVSMALAAMFAMGPWTQWRRDVAEMSMFSVAVWVSGPIFTLCAMRVDPARMSVRESKRTHTRVAVGLVFFLAFAGAAVVLYRFHVHFGIAWMLSPLFFAFVLAIVAIFVGACVWAVGLNGIRDGGGELHDTPRSRWVGVYPLLAVLLPPFSVAGLYWLAVGSFQSARWFVVIFLAFGGSTFSTVMARSTNPILRVIAPMAMLDTPAPVYGFRIFWRDVYVDLSRTTLVRATAIATAVQAATLLFFALLSGMLMVFAGALLTADATLIVLGVAAVGAYASMLIIPDCYGGYSGPWMRLLDTDRLQMFEKLLLAARTASPASADRLNAALSQWLRHEGFPYPLLPDPRAVWKLAPLLILVRLARETGETAALARWRDRIERSLREIIASDAVAVAPGEPPSLHWTTLAATIIDEAELRDALPFDRMLDRIETLLEERLERGTVNLLTDVVAACRLLRRHGRRVPDPESIRRFAHASSLVSRPLLRQSVVELCELADLTGDSELRVKLGAIVRSRSWEALQLNPRKDVLLLLDCYLAAVCLGETDSRQAAAALIIEEVAQRVSEELMAIVTLSRPADAATSHPPR
jgi:hypothetical protein